MTATAATDPSTTAADPADPANEPTIPTAADPAAAADTDPADAEPARKNIAARAAAAAGAGVTSWWGFIRQPMSLAEAWKRSGQIDARRIPADSNLLAILWWWSNRTDRVLLFACIFWAPLWLVGPVLWCAVRPTRRWAMYAVAFFLLVILPAVAKG
jgi:hypothetical protein